MGATCRVSNEFLPRKKSHLLYQPVWIELKISNTEPVTYLKKYRGNKRLRFFQQKVKILSGKNERREWPRSCEKSFKKKNKTKEKNNSYLLPTHTLSMTYKPEILKCKTGRTQSDGPTAGTSHLQDPHEHQRAPHVPHRSLHPHFPES